MCSTGTTSYHQYLRWKEWKSLCRIILVKRLLAEPGRDSFSREAGSASRTRGGCGRLERVYWVWDGDVEVERKAKEMEDVFPAREEFTCHYNERRWLGWKGRFTIMKWKLWGDLSKSKVYYCLSVLLPNPVWQLCCISRVWIDYSKKCKHADKNIANYSPSIKHCIGKGHSLFQAKCWIKKAGWKIHQEITNLDKQSFTGNSSLYVQNVHIQGPGIILPELMSIVVLIPRERVLQAAKP